MMKKYLKLIVAALCALTVTAVGVVSYAAWTSGTKEQSTGTITTGYLDAANLTSIASITANDLMPYDQGSGTCSVTGTIQVENVPTGDEFKIVAKISTDLPNGSLWIQLSASAITPPTTSTTLGSPWVELNNSGVDVVTGIDADKTYNIAIILESTSVNDMNESLTVTLTLEKTST